MEPQTTCPYCKSNVSLLDHFCPVCGKNLKKNPLPTTLARQILIYSLSFFLVPLGIWPAVKYLQQPDQKSKNIGIAALILTAISAAIAVYLTMNLLSSFGGDFSSQLEVYRELGL